MSNELDKIELEIKMTVAHMNTILSHLAKGVYAEVADVVTFLRDQAVPQVVAKQQEIKSSAEVPSPAPAVDQAAETPPTAA